MGERCCGTHADKEHCHAEDVQNLERSVETLPHPREGGHEDDIRGEEGYEARKVGRLE